MVFNSLEFLGFFAVVVALAYLLPARARWALLLAASLYFYGIWSALLVVHILAVTGATYWLAVRIEETADAPRKWWWTKLGIALLVANLFVFKYTAFANETVRSLFETIGIPYGIPEVHLLLPIGISFYTFQLIGYLVDTYKGSKAERHFGIFALFVLFFPKIISGPIERGKSLLPQLHTAPPFARANVVNGLRRMLWGMFQKIVVADQLAPAVNAIYDDPTQYDGIVLAFATFLYAFQVYCDFAGYTNIALGVSETLGYKLSPNFNRPYFATSIQDFWKRWHISLSNWLTDYIYNPLSRTKVKLKWYYWMLTSLFITFAISGLWHGANWTYVVWGMLHGSYLVLAILCQKQWMSFNRKVGLLKRPKLHLFLKTCATFALVCLAYVFFRASSMSDALHVLTHLHVGWDSPYGDLKDSLGATKQGIAVGLLGAAVVMAADMYEKDKKLRDKVQASPRGARLALYYAGVVAILLLGALFGPPQDFIYVRF